MAESQGLVSIVISVYNIEALLPRCLESISAQTYRNLEILLIDDGSTDGSGRLCDEFAATDPRVRVIHQENRGLWAVRNRGVDEAKGEYVSFPDGDDIFDKDYIQLLYEAINFGGKKYPMSICEYRRISSGECVEESDGEPSFVVLEQTDLLDAITHFPSCREALWGANWNKLYRKSALPRPFQRDYRRCQDFDSNLRLFFQVEQAVFVRKVLYYWVQWTGQSTRTTDYDQIRNECRCRSFLDLSLTAPECFADFKANLVENLYRRMIVWKIRCPVASDRKAVIRKIWQMEKKSFLFFCSCRRFSFRRKLHLILSLHAPSLLLMFGKSLTWEEA